MSREQGIGDRLFQAEQKAQAILDGTIIAGAVVIRDMIARAIVQAEEDGHSEIAALQARVEQAERERDEAYAAGWRAGLREAVAVANDRVSVFAYPTNGDEWSHQNEARTIAQMLSAARPADGSKETR